MDEETKAKIIELHDRGLSVHYIWRNLRLTKAEVQQIIEDHILQDYNSLFKG